MAVTPLQGLTIPAASDSPNGPAQMGALGVSTERKLVQVYASTGARDAAFAAAGIPAAAGMLSYVTGTKLLQAHNGSSWTVLPGQLLGYHKRTSSITYTGTELRVSWANASLPAGHRYLVMTSPLRITPVTGETGKANLRYSTIGFAGTGDAVLGSVEANASSASTPVQTPTAAFTFAPGTDVLLSVALCLLRSGGSGNVTLTGSTAQPIELMIFSMGWDTGDTGGDN